MELKMKQIVHRADVKSVLPTKSGNFFVKVRDYMFMNGWMEKSEYFDRFFYFEGKPEDTKEYTPNLLKRRPLKEVDKEEWEWAVSTWGVKPLRKKTSLVEYCRIPSLLSTVVEEILEQEYNEETEGSLDYWRGYLTAKLEKSSVEELLSYM